MKRFLIPLVGLLVVACSKGGDTGTTGTTTTASTTGATASNAAGFAGVSDVFNHNCMPCHNAAKHRGGLSLASYADAMKGGDDGVVIKAGDPDNSLLVKLLNGPSDNPKIVKMPMGGKNMDPADIQKISDWVKAGAKES
jgi:cytochrome c551/c552